MLCSFKHLWVCVRSSAVSVLGKRPVPHYHVSRWINLLFRRLVTCWLTWIWSCVFFNGLKSGKRLADKVGNYFARPQMVLGSISDFYLLWTLCVGKEIKGTKRNGWFYFRVVNICQGLLPIVEQRETWWFAEWRQDSASLIFFRSNQLSGAPPASDTWGLARKPA